MGFFGSVKNFFFETEAQLIIQCELETQREANKKLFKWNEKLQVHNEYLQEKMDKILTTIDEQAEFHKACIDGLMGVISNTVVEQGIKPLAKDVNDSHVKIMESTEGLSNAITGIRECFSVIFDRICDESNKTNMLVDSIVDAKITPLNNTVEAIRSGVGDGNDKLTALPNLISGCFEKTKYDLGLLITTLSNVEEVVTNPKPLADLKDVIDKTLQSAEHINGFLNSEEYKQQWDMNQVTQQLVEVRQLLETVEALFPKPSGESQKEILNLFEDIEKLYLTPKNMMNLLGYSNKQVYSALAKMVKNGSIVLLSRGQYTTPSKLEEYNERQKSESEKSINLTG